MASKARGGSGGTGCEAGILFTHSGKIGGAHQVVKPDRSWLLYADQIAE